MTDPKLSDTLENMSNLPSRDIHFEINGTPVFMKRADHDRIVRLVAEQGVAESADEICEVEIVDWKTGDNFDDLAEIEDYFAAKAEVTV